MIGSARAEVRITERPMSAMQENFNWSVCWSSLLTSQKCRGQVSAIERQREQAATRRRRCSKGEEQAHEVLNDLRKGRTFDDQNLLERLTMAVSPHVALSRDTWPEELGSTTTTLIGLQTTDAISAF